MDSATLTVILSTFGVSMITLIVQVLQFLREGRQHRWVMEQAQFEQGERQRFAATAAANTKAGVAVLSDQIAENTEISKAAFKEANSVNLKIATLGQQLVTGKAKK